MSNYRYYFINAAKVDFSKFSNLRRHKDISLEKGTSNQIQIFTPEKRV